VHWQVLNAGQNVAVQARSDNTITHADISNMTRVLIVRDPFERAHLAYTHSAKNKYIHIGACQGSANCTFGQWVDTLAHDTKMSFQNEHFRPQVKIAQMYKMHYHYLLRVSILLTKNSSGTTFLAWIGDAGKMSH
jgi:hypothetical protein